MADREDALTMDQVMSASLRSCTMPTAGHLEVLAAGQPFEMLGVAGALRRDLRGGVLDLAEITGHQLKVGGADVLVEALQPPGAGNGDDPGLLGE
jgi:hypothetical protein